MQAKSCKCYNFCSHAARGATHSRPRRQACPFAASRRSFHTVQRASLTRPIALTPSPQGSHLARDFSHLPGPRLSKRSLNPRAEV